MGRCAGRCWHGRDITIVHTFRNQVQLLYPFGSQRRVFFAFDQNFNFKIRREHQKNSYEEPILSYIPLVCGKQYSRSQRVMRYLGQHITRSVTSKQQ